ncbi:MAG TPA: bifunctional glutamate N-acetyltransferase/amino-acid acetyltransferase ArgJ [Desulfobacterales bacterium]|nr:bifunctional glutamate N-acetyltransferase/amino-acid acetyltransferase ArgJ [Desulfobacterales bacterium]
MQIIPCPGFKTAGVAAGIKKNGRSDLGLIVSDVPASVAGLFTRNQIQAAPVRLDRERVAGGVCRAVLVNSGNANCCTGVEGYRNAVRMGRAAAAALDVPDAQVLVASTGVIGEPLPVERIESALPGLLRGLRTEGVMDFAEAIMTTDRVPKVVSRQGRLGGRTFTLTGVVKGAGMIRPDVATMLCFLMTDIAATPADLQGMLVAAADRSFNRITVDGDTSTNDTILLLANGLAGAAADSDDDRAAFQTVLDEVMLALAKWVVKDAEGSNKLVEISVRGALSDPDALRIAETIAHSPLVKTALFGEDANWGRILAAAGRAGVPLNPDTVDVFIGSAQMVSRGMGCGKAVEAEATRVLKSDEFSIALDLHLGPGRASVFTCDFSIDYVKINADYRS